VVVVVEQELVVVAVAVDLFTNHKYNCLPRVIR
jgi:hypothetical protein